MTDTLEAPRPDEPVQPGWTATVTGAVESVEEMRRYGRAMRATIRRGEHATLRLPGRDPVAILEAQNALRLPDLVPVRIGRMLQSPFAYYRGTAAVMAHDLAADAVTGHQVLCCGDAHIANFGLFASPGRQLLFDLNDFDEASNAPWEWDVKRFAASVVVGARDNEMSSAQARDATREALRVYRSTLHELFELSTLERYYYQVDADTLDPKSAANARLVRRSVDKARRRTSEQVLGKLTSTREDSGRRIDDVPPITRHVEEPTAEQIAAIFEQYRMTLRADVAIVLSQFTLVDFVLRVVGVGSVGTRCYVALFVGPSGDPLFLQMKEAVPSVLQTYGGHRTRFERLPPVHQGHQGYRVVACQRILQAHSDRFLGWVGSASEGRDGLPPTDFFFRKFRDMKGSVETRGLSVSQYQAYVSLCARLLARAHSQSPGAAAIPGYLGSSDRFDRAVARWSGDYADQVERDFAALESAVRSGRLAAEHGV